VSSGAPSHNRVVVVRVLDVVVVRVVVVVVDDVVHEPHNAGHVIVRAGPMRLFVQSAST
jgi:hypothetical protein